MNRGSRLGANLVQRFGPEIISSVYSKTGGNFNLEKMFQDNLKQKKFKKNSD